MLRFTKHCKDMLQEILTVVMPFRSKFIEVYMLVGCARFIRPTRHKYICTNNHFTVKRFDKVIAEIKWCSFFTHSVV